MNVFIVRAHHEPGSFSNALAERAEKTFRELGATVVISNLYASNFDPVSDRRNFTTVKDGADLKQQSEEAHASVLNGFSPELEVEIIKLESADLLIFSFSMRWFGMPGILKGGGDRGFNSGRNYGGKKLFEKGRGKGKKRGMVFMTTGGGPDGYCGFGAIPPLRTILAPIQRGVFWFNRFFRWILLSHGVLSAFPQRKCRPTLTAGPYLNFEVTKLLQEWESAFGACSRTLNSVRQYKPRQ